MIINWLRRKTREIERRTWLVILLVVICLVVVISVPGGNHVSLPMVQATIDAVSTQSNIQYPTLSARLTQTPVDSMMTFAAPTLLLEGAVEIRQFAASAKGDSARDKVYWTAAQAAGPANTDKCGDIRTAWSTTDPTSQGSLNLYYAQLVRPTQVRVYQNFNPGFITRIDLTDIYGKTHTVYESVPQPNPQCPYLLAVPIKDADYATNSVTIYVDQAGSSGGWNEIDAVELIGTSYN